MKFTAPIKPFPLTNIVLLSFLLWASVGHAQATDIPHSGSCPAHQHMGHGSQPSVGDNHDTHHSPIAQFADSQCSSCHGTKGISINDNIPNLADQNSLYLCGWLVGCRQQGEQCEGHEDIASKLTDQSIIELAEFYAHLPSK